MCELQKRIIMVWKKHKMGGDHKTRWAMPGKETIMKKIINGKLYNTETAEYLGNHSYGFRGDFRRIDEDLYRTKNGAFFLAGEGGGLTKYRVDCDGNGWRGGSDIIALSEEEARAWVEAYLDAKDYIEIFGAPEEA